VNRFNLSGRKVAKGNLIRSRGCNCNVTVFTIPLHEAWSVDLELCNTRAEAIIDDELIVASTTRDILRIAAPFEKRG
jgi:hypothetical protein